MTIGKYATGFVLSLILTIAAYSFVATGGSGTWLIVLLGVLALLQMIVQLLFFLHLGDEAKPHMKIWSFVFMAGTLLIVVGGSIWIMANMNYNMNHMSPKEKIDHMMHEYGKGF